MSRPVRHGAVLVEVGGQPVAAVKARAGDFTTRQEEQLRAVTYADRALRFPDPAWRSAYLGKGEEKAAFLVCDHDDRVFMIEAIDERTYLNGRFVGGEYFAQRRAPGLTGVDFDRGAVIGLRFTGLIKTREFVDGYEWARFQWRPDRQGWLDHLLTGYLRLRLGGRYEHYRRHYGDVHERNVLFEVRGRHERGIRVPVRDRSGRLRLVRVGLQPVDVR